MKLRKTGGIDLHKSIRKLSKIIRLIVLFVAISLRAMAADISALNFNGDLIGKVIPDGSVINSNNELIGYITADGFVYDNENNLIGGVVPQGIAISYNNSILGKINNDGSVTSANDSLIGKVLPNGLVVNDNYDILGASVSPNLVYNDAGQVVGRVTGDGKFYNLSGENTGYVTASGYVYSLAGTENKIRLLGKLITSKMVISSVGKYLGSIAPDGKVMDLKKNIIGNIHANGYVYNKEGQAIGHVVDNGYAFNNNGQYIGVVSYNGEVVNKGTIVARAVNGNRVINKDGNTIGFTVNMAATANTLDGKYLGRITADGKVLSKRNVIGTIGASGKVIDEKGNVIGIINSEGPVFDYLGNLKANAAVGGKIVSLEGVDLGTIRQNDAVDNNGRVIGKTLADNLCFNNNNEFLGISGINTGLSANGIAYKISPYGYIFDENGDISGINIKQGGIYTDDGTTLSFTSNEGKTENPSLNEIAKFTGNGIFLDKNNKLLGKMVESKFITNFEGEMQGVVNSGNLVVNSQNKVFAKILPDNNVVGISERFSQNYGRASNAPISVSINGDYLGANSLTGQVTKGTEIIGKISSNGYVLDNMGALYGKALEMGTVISPDCKVIGVVSDSGEARTSKDAYLGMILANKQVVNETEEVIGYVVQPRAVNGEGGDTIGVSNSSGNVLNYNNQNLGCIDSNGKVRNAQKEIIGQIIPYMSVMGFDNKILGYTNFYGNVVDTSGIQIATVDLDGSIRSKDGKNIGVPFQYTVAFDANNIYLGRVKPDGSVVSDNGENLGYVLHTGEVKTKKGDNGYALYDLYVYDNEGKTIGYIAKNGRVYSIMGEIKGSIYQGFVLDKKQNLIGRGLRDYEIRNKDNQIIGHLNLDGSVVNIKNIEIGKIDEEGRVISPSGDVLGQAGKLQYYRRPSEPKEEKIVEKTPEASEVKTSETEIEDENQEENSINTEIENVAPKTEEQIEETLSPEEQAALETKEDYQVVGIAVTPGGRYIGDVYSNNKVIDESGAVVGSANEKGEIFDNEGNKVGDFEKQRASADSKGMNANWWKQIATGATINPYSSGDEITNVGPGGGVGPGGRYNPRRAAILSQLQDERRRTLVAAKIEPGYDAASYTGWQDDWGMKRTVSTLRVNMDNMITGDKPIPAVLARSLISLGSAPVTAIVERNIYGDSGRNVIIPAGSRIIGGLQTTDTEARFDNTSGGVKLDISWERIIRPDGIAFLLSPGKTQTGDAQGRGGGALGYVDEQLVKKYTLPIVGTMVTSAITYMMAADEDSTGEVETSKQQAASDARQEFMEKMDQILQEIIDSKSQIQPVTYIPAGTRVIIYPMQDLWLRSTKDIQRGVATAVPGGGEGGLVNDTFYDGGGGTTTSTVEKNNSQGSQKVILGNQAQTNNANNTSNNGGTPLLDSGNSQNNQQQPRKNVGAIPPPAADGSVTEAPESEEEISGDIELF